LPDLRDQVEEDGRVESVLGGAARRQKVTGRASKLERKLLVITMTGAAAGGRATARLACLMGAETARQLTGNALETADGVGSGRRGRAWSRRSPADHLKQEPIECQPQQTRKGERPVGQQNQRHGTEKFAGLGANGEKRDSNLFDRKKERKQAVQARWSRRAGCNLNSKDNSKPARQQLEPTETEGRETPNHIGPQNGLLLTKVSHKIGFRRRLDASEPSMSLRFGHKAEIGVWLLLVLVLASVALGVV
jgi:hypothetical protein